MALHHITLFEVFSYCCHESFQMRHTFAVLLKHPFSLKKYQVLGNLTSDVKQKIIDNINTKEILINTCLQ